MTSPGTSSLQIGPKFALASSVIVVLAMGVFWLVSSFSTESILRQQADRLGESLARQTAILVTELVLSNDLISMNVLLNQLTRDGAISQAAVLNVDDQVIVIAGSAVSGSMAEQRQIFASYIAPIALQGSRAGYVRIDLDQSYIEQGISRSFSYMLMALLLLIVVAASATLALSQYYVSLPLRTLTVMLRRARQGNPEPCPFAERHDEVAEVIREYNALAAELAPGADGWPEEEEPSASGEPSAGEKEPLLR